MVLFDNFEAVKFHEENKIFITKERYLYYIYDISSNRWKKYGNAGNDRITVENYGDVTKGEVKEAMGGLFPTRETDFFRLLVPSQLCIRDMIDLLREKYYYYMSDRNIAYAVHRLLLKSDKVYKSYERLIKLFDKESAENVSVKGMLIDVYLLSMDILGRNVFCPQIEIVDGYDSLSYFWIHPSRIVDYTDTNDTDNVAEMSSVEISIEEDDVDKYLTPFLYKYFDNELEANKLRVDYYSTDSDGNEVSVYIEGFEWYLTHNFYTFEAVKAIISDLNDTIEALSTGRENEYTDKLKIKKGTETKTLSSSRDMIAETVAGYNRNRPTVDNTQEAMVIDFYKRLIFRLEYMLKVGEEKGYNLISVMGP